MTQKKSTKPKSRNSKYATVPRNHEGEKIPEFEKRDIDEMLERVNGNHYNKKKRVCLGCSREFDSIGPQNRRCGACKNKEQQGAFGVLIEKDNDIKRHRIILDRGKRLEMVVDNEFGIRE